MALTKVSGGILDPGINVAGIVTATGFDGPFIGGGDGVNAGVVTCTGLDVNGNGDISGNLVIGGNLTANGDFTTLNTTLREVEILRVDANTTAVAGIITQRGSGDIFSVYDTSTEVFKIADGGIVNVGVGLTLADNIPASFGNSNDLQIIHQSGENHFLLNSGNTFFKGDVSWGVRTASNQSILQTNSAYRTVDLYGSTNKVLSTSGIGVTIRNGLYIENSEFNMTTNGSKILDFETGGSNAVTFRHNPSDSGNTTFLKATHGGSLELYDDSDGNVKLTTQGSGVFISGALRLQGTESAYRTGQAQPLIYRSGSTSGSYPFNAFGHLIIQTRIDGSNRDIIFATGTSSVNQIVINSSGDMKFPDGKELQFGGPLDSGDGDLRLYHNATDSYVSNSTGHLRIGNTHDNKNIKFFTDGSTKWDIDSDGHFIPDTAGAVNIGSASKEIGDVYLADDKRLTLGSDQDMYVYHDNIHGYVSNRKNNLYLSAPNYVQIISTDTNGSNQQTGARFLRDGESEIYHSNSLKFTTTGIGVSVIGEVAATQDYPNFRPKIDLNFVANSRMDPRISYTRTGPASFLNEKGKIELVGPDAPRIDHDPSTGECKGLLIEESRTNMFSGTRNMSSPGSRWSIGGSRGFKGANIEGPDGALTSFQVVYNGTSGDLGVAYSPIGGSSELTTSNDTIYTYSVWAKLSAGASYLTGCRLRTYNQNISVNYNLVNGLVLGDGTTATNAYENQGSDFISSSIEEYPNGWYRCIMTFRSGTDGNQGFQLYLITGVNNHALNSSSANGESVSFWGAQLEAGSYATSYIPTSDGQESMTRGTEYAFIEGQDFVDTYNDDEGTFLLQATTETLDNTNHGGWGAEKASNRAGHTFNLGYRIGGGGSGYTGAWYTANGSTSAFHNMNAGVTAGTPFKIAFSYKVNDMGATTNGATVVTDGTAAIDPDFDRFTLGNYNYGVMRKGHIQRAVYYASKITDNQLKTLTS